MPAKRFGATCREVGECSSQYSFEKRRSMREEIVTGAVASHRHEHCGRKERKSSAVYD